MVTNNTLDVSVIICAYTEERWHAIIAAIKSIQQQIVPPHEIILVIDHNTSLLEKARAQITDIILIENSEARGLSGARNSGIAIARGELIAFIDDDAVAEPDWLMRLCQRFEDPQVLGVGGRVEPIWAGKCPSWFPREFYWVVGCSYLGLPEELSVVRNPYGGCTCYRRQVFEVVGGFKNGIGRVGKLPMGGEETELCIRARQYWPEKIFLYDPQAIIHHQVPLNRATWCYFRSRCYAEGLSKALIAQYAGTKDSLASERSYTLRTLPLGVVHNLIDGLLHLSVKDIIRAGAIVYGFFMTTFGYAAGTVSQLPVLLNEDNLAPEQDFRQSLQLNK